MKDGYYESSVQSTDIDNYCGPYRLQIFMSPL